MMRKRYNLNITICLFETVIALASILLISCRAADQPRMRFGAFFGSPISMTFANPDNLGKHNYNSSAGEKTGLIYTCRGGFIDIGHVREAADRTFYLANLTYKNINLGNQDFSFKVIEPSHFHIKIYYPDNWQNLSQQQKQTTTQQLSINLAQYLAHKQLIWHEILTWYGFATAGVFSDRISAFSWEDTYSDVMGIDLAAKALFNNKQKYNEIMTDLIKQKLINLNAQPVTVTKKAANQVKGDWYTGGFYFFVKMKKRNLDIGLNDGQITPWLVNDICPQTNPQPYNVPLASSLQTQGFNFDIQIDPKVFEKNKIYRSINLDQNKLITPKIHFPMIMRHIQNIENKPTPQALKNQKKQEHL
jgi:hypothetical protein